MKSYAPALRSAFTTLLVFTTLLLGTTLPAFAPAVTADDIVGTWLTGGKDGHVQIMKQGDRYAGRLIWGKDLNDPATGKPKTDTKNPDQSLRSRSLLNLPLMSGFRHAGGNVWDDGKIYDPESGKTYSCKLTLKNPNTLDVRGFIGFSLIGRTQTWTRVK